METAYSAVAQLAESQVSAPLRAIRYHSSGLREACLQVTCGRSRLCGCWRTVAKWRKNGPDTPS